MPTTVKPLMDDRPALGQTRLGGRLPTSRQAAESRLLRGFLDRLRGRVLGIQLCLMGLIATLHATLTWAPSGTFEPTLTQAFDVDYEMNFPTWFASMQHFLIGLTLVAIAVVTRIDPTRRRAAWAWGTGAVTAFFLSADEIAAFHERLGGFLEFVLKNQPPDSLFRGLLGFPSYYWMVVYAPFVIPAVIALSVFAWRELGGARRLALLGVFAFLYGAVGLDFIEGHFGTDDHTYLLLTIGTRLYNFDIFLLEELLEMTGLVMVLHALLTHLNVRLTQSLRFGPES